MPRPMRTQGVVLWISAVVLCCALGPAALHVALAAAAGTLFEASPFVLFAEMLPAGRLRALVSSAGCGCGGSVPGALSLPAIALCWLSFGPPAALARTAAGVALALRRRCAASQPAPQSLDPFVELRALAPAAAVSTLLGGAVAQYAPFASATPAGGAAAFGAGLLLGCVSPCGTAAVAVAAGLAPHLGIAAAGVLCTGGLAPNIFRFTGRNRQSEPRGPTRERSALAARLALAAALAALALGGPRGFVNPRLIPFAACGALAGLANARRTTRVAGALATPGLLFVALAAGSPVPSYATNETRLDDAFAGERIAFTGTVHRHGTATLIQRFEITCCRADASPLAVRMAVPLAFGEGAWVSAGGAMEESAGSLVLRANEVRRIAPPADPFIYR